MSAAKQFELVVEPEDADGEHGPSSAAKQFELVVDREDADGEHGPSSAAKQFELVVEREDADGEHGPSSAAKQFELVVEREDAVGEHGPSSAAGAPVGLAFSDADEAAEQHAGGADGAADAQHAPVVGASGVPRAPVVEFDGRRPWPLGLPAKERALAAIVSQTEVAPELEGSHLRVLTLFPEWMFDEARTALGGGGSDVAWAAASAWRAVVALERAEHPLGVDLPALLALTDETVQAREKLVGAAAFSLDGGAGAEELLSTLDECIGRFVVLARHQERARVASVSGAQTRLLSVASAPEAEPRRKLPFVFAASMLLALAFHLLHVVLAPSGDVWVVNGSLENGHAMLVPGGPSASAGALETKLAELRAQHVVATQGGDGQWYLAKEGGK